MTCGDWLSFMEDGGYSRPEFWLSDGWAVGQRPGLGGAPVLVPRPRRSRALVAVHPVGAPARRSRRARLPRQLLRGGRVRPLDRACDCRPKSEWETIAASHGEGDNFLATTCSTRGAPHPRPAVVLERPLRRHLGVDVERLRPVSGLPGRARCRRRVQRQVHGEPVRAAWRLLRHSDRPCPDHLPQLLPARRPLGLRRPPTGPGPLSAWRTRSTSTSPPRRCSARCGPTPAGPAG